MKGAIGLKAHFLILFVLSVIFLARLASNIQSVEADVEVGVKPGNWVNYDYNYTYWPYPDIPYAEQVKVEILSVEGTNVTMQSTMYMSNGTTLNITHSVDVASGRSSLQGYSGFIIPANSEFGDSVFIGGYGNVTLDTSADRTYAGVSRRIFFASISQHGIELINYWDKETGIAVESFMISDDPIGIGIGMVTETNMWVKEAPFWMQWWFWIIVGALVVVAVAGGAYFFKKRKPLMPTHASNASGRET